MPSSAPRPPRTHARTDAFAPEKTPAAVPTRSRGQPAGRVGSQAEPHPACADFCRNRKTAGPGRSLVRHPPHGDAVPQGGPGLKPRGRPGPPPFCKPAPRRSV